MQNDRLVSRALDVHDGKDPSAKQSPLGCRTQCARCPLQGVCRSQAGMSPIALPRGETLRLPRRGAADRPMLVALCEGCLKTVLDGHAEPGARSPIVALHFPGDGVHPARDRRGAVQHVAVSDCVLRMMPDDDISAGSPMWRDAWTAACERIEQDFVHIASLASGRPAQRLAALLCNLRDWQSGEGRSVTFPLSRDDVGAYLGMEPETVSRALGRLEKLGLVHRARRWGMVEISEPDELRRYSGLSPQAA